METAIEKCLDILDERYNNMNKVLKTPVFFDSIEVRQVIEDIRLSHNAILDVALIITKNLKDGKEYEIEEKNYDPEDIEY